MFKRFVLMVALVALLFVPVQSLFAELSAVGPVNPQNGFPVWYQDSNGTAVELGLDPALNLFDPPIPGNAFSEQIGFGAEGFYWIAEAFLDFPGGEVFYRAALEYAFANEEPADGDQFVFGRLRFRIDVPVAGTYTVTHPYGVDTFVAEVAGVRAINVTIDVGGVTPDFATALTSRIGPFLTMVNPAPPAGFLGNGAVVTGTVTGSPFGTNFLRIQGPGGIDAQTDQFIVAAKIFTGQVNTPLTVERATYTRAAHESVDVIATSTPTATVVVEELTPLPAAMAGDGTGKFYRHVHNVGPLPPTITVRADDDPLDPVIQPTGIIKNLVDHVAVTTAEYDTNAKTLVIDAVSGDLVTPPVLTATGFGPLVGGTLTVSNVIIPPASVTVTSSAGGSDTRNVNIVEIAPPPPNVAPTAANDTANTTVDTPVTLNVLGNDVDIDGAIVPATLTITTPQPMLTGTAVKNLDNTITFTPALGFVGAAAFNYTVADDLGVVSNVATVTVNVGSATPPLNLPPVANNDAVTTNVGIELLISPLGNDTDADGAIDPASITVVTGTVNGALVNNLDGTFDYTPNAGFIGQDTFTYSVRDNLGALSNTATVTITVNALETVTVTRAIFRITGAIWIVRGTDSLANPAITMTVRLARTGQTIGTAAVDTLGNWSLSVRGSTVIPQAGDTVTATSSNGVTASLPVTIIQ